MRNEGSVTGWLRALEQGDEDAARRLWERYSGELHQVAKRRMRRLARRDIVDEEDVVISAFASVCMSARNGLLDKVANRDELWGLMIVATQRKVGQRVQYVTAGKRQADQNSDHEAVSYEVGSRLQRLADNDPSPASATLMAEQAEVLLAKLKNPDLRTVAIMRLAGHTNEEIAEELGYATRTVQRMLSLIRTCWNDDAPKPTNEALAEFSAEGPA